MTDQLAVLLCKYDPLNCERAIGALCFHHTKFAAWLREHGVTVESGGGGYGATPASESEQASSLVADAPTADLFQPWDDNDRAMVAALQAAKAQPGWGSPSTLACRTAIHYARTAVLRFIDGLTDEDVDDVLCGHATSSRDGFRAALRKLAEERALGGEDHG